MTDRRGKEQHKGPLKGHFKQGRIYRPPLLAYDRMVLSDWVKDDLPDLLWPILLIARFGDEGIIRFRKLQQLIIEALGEEALDAHGIDFDGRLTSLDAIPEVLRSQVLGIFRESSAAADAIPPQLPPVLHLYDEVPGAWLLLDPFAGADTQLTPEEAANVLLRAMGDVVSEGHLNALVKCAPLGWRILRGKITFPASEVELLRDYPRNPETRGQVDAMIRSAFLAFKGPALGDDSDWHEAKIAWARSFWRQNWQRLPCLPEEQESIEESEDTEDPDPADNGGDVDLAATAEQALGRVAEMFKAFLRQALDPAAPVDLYSPARHEVTCGLVARATRVVGAALSTPHLWSGEHGVTPMRVLAETTILLSWMNQQDDASVYERFQNYGRGKQKLMKYHFDELIESFPDEPPVFVEEVAKRLDEKMGGGWGLSFQDVNVESTFSGLSVRQMAAEADLHDTYRYVYQPASGVTHGEWWALEDYVMQRCMNPLHLFHSIPSFELEPPITPQFGPLLVHTLQEVIDLALKTLFPTTRPTPDPTVEASEGRQHADGP
jgi:hypothetical protein